MKEKVNVYSGAYINSMQVATQKNASGGEYKKSYSGVSVEVTPKSTFKPLRNHSVINIIIRHVSGFSLVPYVFSTKQVPTHTYRDLHYEVIGGSKRFTSVVSFAFFASKCCKA